MTKELTQEFAFGLGYELIYRTDYFILEGFGIPNIKGKIVKGIARDVAVCYETIPCGLDCIPPEAAISFAHKILSRAHMAKCIEGMPVIKPEPINNTED